MTYPTNGLKAVGGHFQDLAMIPMSIMSAAKKVALAKTRAMNTLSVQGKSAAKARLASKARLQSLTEENDSAVRVWREGICGPIPLAPHTHRPFIFFSREVGGLVVCV